MEYLKSEIEAKDALISELNKIMVNGRVEVDKIGLIASQALDMNNALTKEVDTLQKDLLKMKKKAKFNFAGGAIASALLILILL